MAAGQQRWEGHTEPAMASMAIGMRTRRKSEGRDHEGFYGTMTNRSDQGPRGLLPPGMRLQPACPPCTCSRSARTPFRRTKMAMTAALRNPALTCQHARVQHSAGMLWNTGNANIASL